MYNRFEYNITKKRATVLNTRKIPGLKRDTNPWEGCIGNDIRCKIKISDMKYVDPSTVATSCVCEETAKSR